MKKSNLEGSPTLEIDPKTSALLIIDMQNDATRPEGKLAAINLPEPAAALIPHIRKLIDSAHSVKMPVVYTKSTHRHDHIDTNPFSPVIALDATKEGSWGAEIDEELKPAPEDIVVVKHRWSSFYCTLLEPILKNLGIKTLLITGVLTNACVLHTTVAAHDRDYRTIVVRDCVASGDPEKHGVALKVMEHCATIASSEGVVKVLTHTS